MAASGGSYRRTPVLFKGGVGEEKGREGKGEEKKGSVSLTGADGLCLKNRTLRYFGITRSKVLLFSLKKNFRNNMCSTLNYS